MKPNNLDKFYLIHSLIYDFTRPLFLPCRYKAVEALDVRSGDVIYDFGCGTGYNIHNIEKINRNVEITGIDLSKHMLSKARKKSAQAKFEVGDVTKINLPHKADKVISSYAVSMVENWEESILNMKKHLKPDGKLVIVDFHPFQGVLKPFYSPFKLWLKAHGVRPNGEMYDFLKRHFKHVEQKLYYSGYCFLVKATEPVR